MIDEERITSLEQRAEKLERNDRGFAEAIKALMESSLHHTQMMDDFFRAMNELREAQANTDVKIAALVDAQIRAEDEISLMREGINGLTNGMSELRESMKEIDLRLNEKLDRLTDIVITHVTDANAHINKKDE